MRRFRWLEDAAVSAAAPPAGVVAVDAADPSLDEAPEPSPADARAFVVASRPAAGSSFAAAGALGQPRSSEVVVPTVSCTFLVICCPEDDAKVMIVGPGPAH